MIYFEKIEAYFSGTMNEMEQSIFEQALEENTVLQKEYEAYQSAQSLFNFTAETLSEKEITTSNNATETVEQLINFTANNLSEQEILGSAETVDTQRQAIVRRLKTRKNRTEWLVAASMLLILSLIGSRFYNNNSIEPLHTPTEVVVEKTTEPKIETPIEQEKTIPTAIIAEPAAKVVKKVAKKRPVPKYEPAKVRIRTKTNPVVEPNQIAATEKMSPTEITATIANPIAAVLTSAEKIVTGKVINKGEAFVYEAGNSITLKPGFHAKAGASFVATSNKSATTVIDLTKSEVIDNQEATIYNASNSITLKPGFHAKAGSDFVASTTNSSAAKFVSTNAVISEKEAVVVKADEGITLKAGFHAKAGADFVAKVKK